MRANESFNIVELRNYCGVSNFGDIGADLFRELFDWCIENEIDPRLIGYVLAFDGLADMG